MKYLKHTALLIAPLLLSSTVVAGNEFDHDYSGRYNCQAEIAAGLTSKPIIDVWKPAILEPGRGFILEVKLMKSVEVEYEVTSTETEATDLGKMPAKKPDKENYYHLHILFEGKTESSPCFVKGGDADNQLVLQSINKFFCEAFHSSFSFNLERGKYLEVGNALDFVLDLNLGSTVSLTGGVCTKLD